MTVPRVTLAAGGPEFSRLIYGVWRLLDDPEGHGVDRVLAKIDAALECGITTFDHADIYGSYGCEHAFGEAIRARPSLRDSIEIVTKTGIAIDTPNRPQHRIKHYDTSRGHIVASAEQSLRNLGVDVIDLYLIHRPDPLLDPDETAAALTELMKAGKVRQVGVSNFTPSQLDALQSRLAVPLCTNQVEYSVLCLAPHEDGTFDQCLSRRIRPMAWSPLGGGRLFSDPGERHLRVLRELESLGARYGAGVDTMAIAWTLRHPAGALPVIGSNRVERIRAAAAAADIEFDRQDWFSVLRASNGHDIA